jgi:ABC-type amino acid transport substrate-binding protein
LGRRKISCVLSDLKSVGAISEFPLDRIDRLRSAKGGTFFMKKSFLGLMGLFGLMLTSVTSCGANSFDNTKLVIGLECNYAPFNWSEIAPNDYTLKVANKTNMWADGYDVQIGKILSEKLEIPVEIHQIDWDSLIPELTFGNINAVIAGMTDTEER